MNLKSDNLGALFKPQSIAFLGASERPNTPASRGLRNCLRLGFKGGLYPINPKYDDLFGVKCYADLDALPEVPELVMIGLSAERTLDAVIHCEKIGVKSVVICSAGWEEQGAEGQERADKLAAFLQDKNMRVLGPNCLGAGSPSIGYSLGYNSSFESLTHQRKGEVALITQSGAMMGGLLLNAEDAGSDVAFYAHIGNGMDIGMEEITDYLLNDDGVKAIALMIEGLHNPKYFVEVARKAQKVGKPIVVFKAGRSETGREAVLSHTGALAGSDEVFSAVCEETSIIRVDEAEDLLSTATALARWSNKQPVGQKGLVVFTLSGGAASIIADDCAALDVPLANLTEATKAKLEPLLPFFVKVGNPFDIGGAVFTDPDLPHDAMAIVLEDENVDSIIWIGVGAPRDDRSNLWLNQALDVLEKSDKAGVLLPVSGFVQEEGFARARSMGVPVARSIRSAVDLVSKARSWNNRKTLNNDSVLETAPKLPENTKLLDEVQGKSILKELGIRVPESRVASNINEILQLADQLSYPVVLKGMVDGIMHKSDLGLVALSLNSAQEVQAAAQKMQDINPDLNFDGFLIESMAPKGIEVVLGIKRDESFGPVLMFGLGGVFVELFKDVSFATCPITPETALNMISKTKAAVWLNGFRGQEEGDIDALVDAMVSVSQFAAYYADTLVEMDVNPITVLPKGQGVVALDAVIVLD